MKKLLLVALLLAAPAFAQVFVNLDETATWKTCGTCGNSAGSSAKAVYSVQAQSAVSRDGLADEFSIAANDPYANGFWYNQLGANNEATQFSLKFSILIPAAYVAAPQAIEFQIQQVIAGEVFNFAFQANWRSKIWKTFDYAGGGWRAAKAAFNPATLADGNWHCIKITAHRDPVAHTAIDDTLTVDGVTYAINAVHQSKFRYPTSSNALNHAFQLDSNYYKTPYSVYVDDIEVSAQ